MCLTSTARHVLMLYFEKLLLTYNPAGPFGERGVWRWEVFSRFIIQDTHLLLLLHCGMTLV